MSKRRLEQHDLEKHNELIEKYVASTSMIETYSNYRAVLKSQKDILNRIGIEYDEDKLVTFQDLSKTKEPNIIIANGIIIGTTIYEGEEYVDIDIQHTSTTAALRKDDVVYIHINK